MTQATVTEFLEGISLYEAAPSLFREAGLLPGEHLRSLDALHLASAVRLGVEALVTYDGRKAESAIRLGLSVLDPGSEPLAS